MNQTVEAPATDVDGFAPARKRDPINVAEKSAPSGLNLTEAETGWLVNHLCTRWETLYNNLGAWRSKMAKYERMSEEDYSDRKGEMDGVNDSSVIDIFGLQNDTLGTAAGFYDFHFAQAKDDIFGTRPWMAATPEGKNDAELADVMSKHAQWKFNQSDVESALIDALRVSTWAGTAFVKAAYRNEVETYMRKVPVAVDVEAGEPLQSDKGGYIQGVEELEAIGVDGESMEWKEQEVEDVITVYSNVTNALIDYKDIAFESTASDLDLRFTDVFCRFRMGLKDAMELYGIPDSEKPRLIGAVTGQTEEARSHRDETERAYDQIDDHSNPLVKLVEGYVRCAPKLGGKMVRLHVIFAPELNALFSINYLANVTPGAILPIFPVRINRIPNRVFGKGMFEKYENANNAIDRQYNLITWRNRTNGNVYTGVDTSVLEDEGEGEDFKVSPEKVFKLKADKKISDLFSFATAPDNNGRSEMLLNSMMQMIQMRSGITSAAQGELKGVPSANTATGTNSLMSRGATLLKAPIDEQTKDLQKIVEFDVILIYANQKRDETFTWGEGREAVLFTIKAGDVEGIRANVSLTLTQSQNQQKLDSAMKAINIVQSYVGIPEVEKPSARPAFVQALSSIGFNNAEDIIRPATVDPAGILALLPPEAAGVVQQALVEAGMMAAAPTPAENGVQPPAPV